MPFYPGNQISARSQRLSRALERALAADDWKRLHQGCDRLADAFAEGQAWALQMVFDRVEGRARQSIDVSSNADARGLDLAQVVQAVLAARSAQSEDAQIVNTEQTLLTPVLAQSVDSVESESPAASHQASPDPPTP